MILFRADGNSILGAGHIMRCLSIADALRDIGIKSEFVLAESCMKSLIENRGYEVHVLGTAYSDISKETGLLKELDCFKSAKVIVVDSYYVDADFFSAIKEKKTVFIDDYFTKLPVDLIINYSVYADRTEYEKIYSDNHPILLLGPQYAPLRKEFSEEGITETKQVAENVLVLTGGSDSLHVAVNIAKEVLTVNDKLRFRFVVGMMSEDFEKMKQYESESNGRIEVYHNVQDMKGLMCSCDMAISAAGSTMYELCACSVPTINYTLADNQLSGALAFEKESVMKYAGDVRTREGFYRDLYQEAKKLSEDRLLREKMARKGKSLVDGLGAKRLAEKLKEIFSEQ